MSKTYIQVEQQQPEEELLTNDNEVFINDDFHVRSEEFSFSQFLVKIVGETRKTVFKRESLFYNIQLLISLIMFTLATIIGAIFLHDCAYERMICIFLIVQGVCGLFVVLIHIIGTMIDCNSNDVLPMKWIFVFAHCVVVFCIIWFIFGHVWIFQKPPIANSNKSCLTIASSMALVLLLFEYILGIGYFCSRLWNNSHVLQYIQTIIQRQLNSMTPRRVLAMADESTNEEDEKELLFVNLNVSHIVFLLIGAILCGIPLLVVLALYTNASISTLSGSSLAPIPIQCFTYTLNTDATRLHTYQSCCGDDRSITPGWYRFGGGAGTQLATRQPSSTNMCGASYPGWWNGTLPMTMGDITVGNVCFFNGASCVGSLTPASATNCGDFYVFYLTSVLQYGYRYCTML